MRRQSLAQELAKAVLNDLSSVASPERKEGMSRYFTTSTDCLGVSTPQLRSIARRATRRLHREDKATVLQFAEHLFASNAFEARQAAFEVVSRHGPSMNALTLDDLDALGSGNDNWAAVDALSTLITGVLWVHRRIPDEAVLGWARRDSIWWRRTALVSTVPLNLKKWGGRGDPDRTLAVVNLLAGERNPSISKAVSWALRALSAWFPERVERYLDEKGEVVPALVRREVRRKLETGTKNPRR